MITPDYIERSNRKTLSLSILKDGKIVVKAPLKMKDSVVYDFVLSKQNWIEEKLEFIHENRKQFDDVVRYERFLLYGNRYTPIYSDVKKIETDDKFQLIIPRKTDKAKVLKTIKSWYKKCAKEVLGKRLKFIENRIRIQSTGLRIGDSKGRWGSCNSRGAICFNFRVVMLPPDVIDYVIVHELCHIVEMNHSKKFWALVEKFLPSYQKLKNKIKDYGFLLSLLNEI
ncbi:MAG: M48 family metallopeptidase [Clostridia bacterium]|nr:M48 family metallopeptidase [Clostridia bacterium]